MRFGQLVSQSVGQIDSASEHRDRVQFQPNSPTEAVESSINHFNGEEAIGMNRNPSAAHFPHAFSALSH